MTQKKHPNAKSKRTASIVASSTCCTWEALTVAEWWTLPWRCHRMGRFMKIFFDLVSYLLICLNQLENLMFFLRDITLGVAPNPRKIHWLQLFMILSYLMAMASIVYRIFRQTQIKSGLSFPTANKCLRWDDMEIWRFPKSWGYP